MTIKDELQIARSFLTIFKGNRDFLDPLIIAPVEVHPIHDLDVVAQINRLL